MENLLFFDTFSHEINEDINLDLVQFPKPVYITEVRIIPLGARVQADFPGGVRLGATNPSKFGIEFFVNDLGKPGASTFERLGNLEYNQNNCINLECSTEKIPTDGLVLRGWYTTITLAVYGTLTKNLVEQIASPPATPSDLTLEQPDEIIPTPIEIVDDPVPFEYPEVSTFEEPPVDGRGVYADDPYYTSQDGGGVVSSSQRLRMKSRSSERSLSRNRTYSSGNDREYGPAKKREWSRSPDYRHSRRIRGSRHDSDSHGEHGKRPRTPIDTSPPRPQSPDEYDCEDYIRGKLAGQKLRERMAVEGPEEPTESIQLLDDEIAAEQFEPILSDDEILGDEDSQSVITTPAIDAEDIEMEELIDYEIAAKLFDPFKVPLTAYDTNLEEICGKDLEMIRKMFNKFTTHIKFSSVKEFFLSSFDEKELFVNLCELLVNQLNHIGQLPLKKRNFILKKIFKDQRESLNLTSNILKISLDFECACAHQQPGYKIRHIKIGPRLAELLLSSSTELLKYYCEIERMDPFKSLFDLFRQQHMSLSIKLIILRSMYAILDTRYGVQIFIHSKTNGYQHLLMLLQNNPPTRAKFAIKSIIKKINLYETLETIRELCTKYFVLTNFVITDDDLEDFEKLSTCLQTVIEALASDSLSFQQPKRFLPVSNKFEIIKDPSAWKSWAYMLQTYFKELSLCESLLLILSNQQDVPLSGSGGKLLTTALDLISAMAKSQIGIDYFIDDALESTQLLVKCLLGLEEQEEVEEPEDEVGTTTEDIIKVEDTIEPLKLEELKEKTPELETLVKFTHIQKLGIEIAFKMQTRYHIDAISCNRENIDILCEHLHALYSQTITNYNARLFTTEVLGFNGNLNSFLCIIEKERKIQSKRQQDSPGAKYKSPSLSYSVDILDCCVRNCSNLEYLIDHCLILLDLVKHHAIFEPSVSAVLQEMAVYLKPLEVVQNFSYSDVNPLSEVIKRSIEYITTFPGDLIMGLRILRHLCIGSSDSLNCNSQTKELKLRYVTLQFYSADGILTLLSILEKLTTYFEQPGLHSPTLMTIQGVHTCEIILPTLKILREILTFLIQCRDTQFKDLTAIEPLMKTYFLMHYFPETSQAYDDAVKIRREIVEILLAYTQPNEEEEEMVHKSLWTQMMREVIKCILYAPSTFIPGLKLLAELIPLPLPIPTLKVMTDCDSQRLVTERKLWSAHLHPDRSYLIDLIQTICPTSFPQLADLLTRVCLQLADLAPNMSLLVSKTITDLITAEISQSSIGTAHLARLLNFLAQLTIFPSIKISTLSILPGKLHEYFGQILSSIDKSEIHQLCQTNVLRVLETFFDSEISMINAAGVFCENLEMNLASALPGKELIPELINGIFGCLMNADDAGGTVSQAVLRNFILLTEHDITFFYLRHNLLTRKTDFQKWLQKFIEFLERSMDKGQLSNIVLFLRNLIVIDELLYATVPVRNLNLSFNELRDVLNWTPKEPHSIRKLKLLLESDEPNNLEALLLDVSDLIDKLDSPPDQVESSPPIEPGLPQAEGIVTLFLARPIYTICENLDDVQLGASFWLEPIRLDEMQTIPTEMIQCNLAEMVSTCLPSDTNLSSDCKRVLHLSASPQSNRERTTTAPCFRTRRVEVEPQTGRVEKKIFVSPMRGRGFTRTPPTRGDLFRSRPPNTSRPPSLHVDDFLALETCGAQPTGPTGYNKLSRDIIGIRGTRGRGRARIAVAGGIYRKPFRGAMNPQHFRTATSEPVVVTHFAPDSHYSNVHFPGTPPRGRGRGRARAFFMKQLQN